MTFGRSSDADVRAVEVAVGADGRATFALVAGGRREPVRLAVAGEHMVGNALAAAAVGIGLGVPPDEAAAALSARDDRAVADGDVRCRRRAGA